MTTLEIDRIGSELSLAEASSTDIVECSTPLRKRVFDIAVSIPLCLVAAPIVVVLAAILAVQHRASPFFVHERIGQGGRLFRVPKLRTLSPHTDPYADKTVTDFAMPSRLAQALRKTHLDELPQLFLVPLGRMSLVGPRPRMEAEAREFGDHRFDDLRTAVPQGCTGLWQIGAHKHGRVSDSPEYDEFYVNNWTMRLDAWILLRTLAQFGGMSRLQINRVPKWLLSPARR